MNKNTLKSIGSVVAGFFTVTLLSIATDILLESTGIFPPPVEGLFVTWMLVLALAYRTVYTVAGGYITAVLAPNRKMRHVIALAIIGVIGGTLGVVSTWGMNLSPTWYPISLAVLAYPSVWLGGWLYQQRTNK